jgi:5-methylcytosine-specific restriction enzyme subunit McrC
LLELVEYGSRRLRLEEREVDYLLDLVERSSESDADARVLTALTPTRVAGVFDVTAGPYVGRLGLPSGRWIDFTSRFAFDDVVALIRHSQRLPIRADALVTPGSAGDFLVDVLAMAFARDVGALAARGLAKGYRSVRKLTPPYGGRMDVVYHLSRLAARPDRMATVSRRLTIDVPENQALASALDVLLRVPLPRTAAQQLAGLASVFRPVSRQTVRPDEVGRIVLNRLTERYRSAVGLAQVILRSQALLPAGLTHRAGSVLFYMPKVWEAFVARWVEQQRPTARVISGYRFPLSSGGLVAEADVTVWRGNELVELFDAKYKWPVSAPERSDLYQMITYCDRLRLLDATLVYPVETENRTVHVGSRSVRVLGLVPSQATGSCRPMLAPDS